MKKFLRKLFRRKISTETKMKRATGHSHDYIITLTTTYSNGDTKVQEYIGNCTCWSKYPSFEPCDCYMEAFLYRTQQKHLYEGL